MKKTLCITAVGLCLLTGCSDKQQQSSLAKVRSMNNVVTNPSGLKYEILKQGNGTMPVANQKVTVHYTGWLEQDGQPGTEFDSSFKRNQPFSFILGAGQVIKGWDEGVASMSIGEKRRLVIPSSLGYGARGAGGAIPPFATLIFDVELLSIQ